MTTLIHATPGLRAVHAERPDVVLEVVAQSWVPTASDAWACVLADRQGAWYAAEVAYHGDASWPTASRHTAARTNAPGHSLACPQSALDPSEGIDERQAGDHRTNGGLTWVKNGAHLHGRAARGSASIGRRVIFDLSTATMRRDAEPRPRELGDIHLRFIKGLKAPYAVVAGEDGPATSKRTTRASP